MIRPNKCTWSTRNEEASMPREAMREPSRTVRRMPSLSERMPETGERKKVVPTATEPTREALVAESGSSP